MFSPPGSRKSSGCAWPQGERSRPPAITRSSPTTAGARSARSRPGTRVAVPRHVPAPLELAGHARSRDHHAGASPRRRVLRQEPADPYASTDEANLAAVRRGRDTFRHHRGPRRLCGGPVHHAATARAVPSDARAALTRSRHGWTPWALWPAEPREVRPDRCLALPKKRLRSFCAIFGRPTAASGGTRRSVRHGSTTPPPAAG